MRTLALLLLGAAALAAPQWRFKVVDTVPPGKPAEILLSPINTVHGVTLELVPEEGKPQVFKVKKIDAGGSHRVRFKVPKGISKWTGKLTGSADGETTVAPLSLKIVSAAPLSVRLSLRDIDLHSARVVVHGTNPVAKAEIRAFGDGGAQVVDAMADVEHVSGDAYALSFMVPDDTRLRRVELKVHDEFGFWSALRIVSWYAEIDHEEVNFPTAEWNIPESETPKVDQAIVALNGEIERFRRELGNDAATLDVQVYVAGYTDTVGSGADNKRLSDQRAQSIARYFRANGVKVPIHYQGFGEDALAVDTPDNTDEAKNRRALYVLANVPPRGGAFPRAAWRRLQ